MRRRSNGAFSFQDLYPQQRSSLFEGSRNAPTFLEKKGAGVTAKRVRKGCGGAFPLGNIYLFVSLIPARCFFRLQFGHQIAVVKKVVPKSKGGDREEAEERSIGRGTEEELGIVKI